MIENYVGARRSVPLHAPVQQDAEAQDTAQNNGLQVDAAVSSDVQVPALPRPEDFTISVEQVREHFRSKGVHKSKDTVQRWCRSGDLDCQKRGVLNRYFTTETSLKSLEKKLLPDMIAETSGELKPVETSVQPDAAAPNSARSDVPLHAGEDAAANPSTQADEPAAPPLHTAAPSASAEPGSDLSRVMAENEGLREQLKNRDSEIEFLREEVRAGRDQRGAVVQISNRMLETLESIAIGGRIERPANNTGGVPEPVRYSHPDNDPRAV